MRASIPQGASAMSQTQTMKALVKRETSKGIWMEQVPVPVIGPNEVLIKLEKTAICGTDLHIYKWDEWSQRTIQPGLVIGHEFVGRIVELGPGVTGYSLASASAPKVTSSAGIAATAAPASSTCARTRSASA
jgi:threonine dehydrogenase-like Zn-dependent dehydrogenase